MFTYCETNQHYSSTQMNTCLMQVPIPRMDSACSGWAKPILSAWVGVTLETLFKSWLWWVQDLHTDLLHARRKNCCLDWGSCGAHLELRTCFGVSSGLQLFYLSPICFIRTTYWRPIRPILAPGLLLGPDTRSSQTAEPSPQPQYSEVLPCVTFGKVHAVSQRTMSV